MAHISRKEWEELIQVQVDPVFSRKEVLIKFSSSLGLIVIYIFVATALDVSRDVQLAIPLLIINIAGLMLVAISRTEIQIRWLTYVTLILFMWYMAYVAYSLANMRGMVYFLLPTVLYFFEMERLSWIKWQIPSFILASMLPLFVLPYEPLLMIAIGFLFAFIGVVTHQGNKKRLELLVLKESQKGYELFMKHTRLIEHYVINSVSKLVYVSEMLKDLHTERPDDTLKEQIDMLDQEISSISKTITSTNTKDLTEFNI